MRSGLRYSVKRSPAPCSVGPLNEAETRAEYVDPALKASGWGVVDGSRIAREVYITKGRLQVGGKRSRAEIADYILQYRNTRLAVIEAKRRDVHHTEGAAQAKAYATKLGARFAYATNGHLIYEIDMVTGIERDVEGFPGPEELWTRTFGDQNAWR